MATLTLDDLLTAQTAESIKALLLSEYQEQGLPTTDWSVGGVERTNVEVEAAVIADLIGATLPAIAGGGFADTATGDWLTYRAKQFYALDRYPATFSTQTVRLTCASGAGPYTVSAGDLWFQATSGNRYFNTTGGTVTDALPLDVTVQAESPGATYNDGAGTIIRMTTPLAGVTCTNPAGAYTTVVRTGSGSGTVTPSEGGGSPAAHDFEVEILSTGQRGVATFRWRVLGDAWSAPITTAATYLISAHHTQLAFADHASINPSFIDGDVYRFSSPGTPILVRGVDEESDASLQQRCRDRWPSLSAVALDGKYRLWALAASTQVKKVKVASDGSGTVTVTIAGSNGAVGAEVATTVQTYLTARADVTDNPTVALATALAITLGGTVTIAAESLASAQAAADVAWQTYIETVDIAGTVRISKLWQVLMDAGATDVASLTLNGGGTNVALGASQVAQVSGSLPSTALTWTVA